MCRILLIQTGGTIESIVSDGIADVSGNSVSLRDLSVEADRDVTIDAVQPLRMLSENLTPPIWRILADSVRSGLSEGYDGILITHGSDTLPYTAAMLGYLFGGLAKIPIVITAANFPPADPRSNARKNLTAAVALIKKSVSGCYGVWTNPNCKTELHMATQMAEAGYIRDTLPYFGDLHLDGPLAPPEIPADFSFELPFIFMIKNYPGCNYASLNFTGTQRPAAILHILYHSATGCVSADLRCDLPEFVRRMSRQGIPVYGLGFKEGQTVYASVPAVLESGLIPLPLMTAEAALVKLQLAYALCPEDPLPLLQRNWYHEFLI